MTHAITDTDLGCRARVRSVIRVLTLAAVVAGTIAGYPAIAHANPPSAFIDIGLLAGQQDGVASQVNSAGHVVGTSPHSSAAIQTMRAFFHDGAILRTPCSLAVAHALNSTDVVVGAAAVKVGKNYVRRAARCVGSTQTALGTLGGSTSDAYDINDSGLVVGVADTGTGSSHAFRYSGGVMTSLTPSLGGSSAATAVNEAGAIVGSVPAVNGGTQAVVWSGPGYTAQFLTSPPGWSSVRPIDIDENGVVLGSASNAGGPFGTIVWVGGTPTEISISLPGGYTWYSPAARNTRGQIVGKASTYGWSPFTGWLYDNGRIYDLNVYMPSGYSVFSVDDINEAGDITGTMYLAASGTGKRPFLLKVSDLVRYLPEYRFSIQEPYRPAAAGLATDTYTPTETHENTNLFKVDGVPVAASDPARALAQLSLNYLGSFTPSGLIESIDEASYYGSQSISSLLDYQSMLQRFPGVYSDRIYGRVVLGAGGEKLLQYWAYYYYNQKTYICCGEHEGDWELVQIRLSAAGTPMSASYAQHGSPERCLWTDVEKSTTGQPVVWVADGSHASYFWAGSHPLPGMQVDTTGTESSFFSTVIQLEDVTSTPAWLFWNGYWGSSVNGSLAPSPRSPGVQAAWDAFAWEPGVECAERPSSISPATEAVTALSHYSVAGGLASSVIAPPVPRFTTMIFRKAVRIAYCFDKLPSDPRRRPWQVFVSLDNPYDALPPATLGWPVTERCGRISHPRGVVKRPYILRLSARSKYGNQSRIIQRALG